MGWGAVGPQRVLPALQVGPEHLADGLPNILNLRYCDVAVVLFSGRADSKRLFQVVLWRTRDNLVNLANPMWFQMIFWREGHFEGAKGDDFRNEDGVEGAAVQLFCSGDAARREVHRSAAPKFRE